MALPEFRIICNFSKNMRFCCQFLAALSCPIKTAERNALLDWLLGYAVRLEYGDNGIIFILT